MPTLAFEPVEGADHGIVFKEPELVSQLIVDFLTEGEARRSQAE
jgi:hypothetical protein